MNRSNIVIYLKCVWCKRDGIEPRVDIGFTSDGNLQLWCVVHDAAIGPPFELRFPPLVASLTCETCHDTANKTHEHAKHDHDHGGEKIGGNDQGHDHGHEKQG
jgi:hypothetical protein